MMRTLLKTTMLLLLLVSSGVYGQRGIGTNTPDKAAILELNSTTKGFLFPRLKRNERDAIATPAEGLMIYCTDCSSGKISFYNNSYWSDVPNAPVIGTATAGAAQASVSYTVPVESRGSDITSYTATASPGGFTGTLRHPGNGTIIVTGLANGTEYTFTVTAANVTGAGPASAASNSVTPVAVPGAPGIGTATESSGQAAVAYTAPADDGGSVITRYTATASPGGFTGFLEQDVGGTIIVTGLANGTAYTFTVTATNGIGTGAASAASNSVTPATVPGAPGIGTATAGNAQAAVPYTAPAANGGSVITGYTATASPGGFTGSVTREGDGTIIVTGLANGTGYTFTVTATNGIGTGPASAASNSVTPIATVPGAPGIGTATAGNAQAAVAYTAPADDGGSDITTYTATASPGGFTGSVTREGGGTIIVTGLANGTGYTFTVTATNAIGTGAASAASNSVMPVNPLTVSNITYQGASVIDVTGIGYNGEAVPASSTITVDLTNAAGTEESYGLSATDAGSGLIYSASGTIVAGATISVILTHNGVVMPALESGVLTMELTGASTAINLEPRIDIKSIPASATQVTDVVYGTQTWMDRNLGARRVAEAENDVFSYGNYYQWGRPADGHEIMVWNGTTKNSGRGLANVTATLAADANPSHANFITSSSDWLATPATSGTATLWATANQGPCPANYHVPSLADWNTADTEALGSQDGTNGGNTTGWDNNTEVYDSTLKLPSSGYRLRTNGTLLNQGPNGFYWSSTGSGTTASSLYFNSTVAYSFNTNRANGFTVRCLKD
jgi:uncharacterized protein (TIGR02145 family)